MNVITTVIPAAGFGTRMLPAAKAVPKELLPVLDRPALQHIVEEAANAGVTNAVLVTSPDKRAIEEHFGESARLRERLESAGKTALLASIDALLARMSVTTVHQLQQKGLGDAVLQAKALVKNQPFLCQLGDAVFSGDVSPARQLIDAAAELGTAVIGLEEVVLEKVSRYGIVGGAVVREGILKLDTLVEKPAKESAPSRYAIAARYVLTPAIFDCLEQTRPGAGGEIQLTDALKHLLSREPIHGIVLRARRHDIGNPVDWLKTNLVFASRDAATWEQLSPLLRSLMK
ncbi:MAG TPA: UTP--glucose-1-phosphate uridylyltransferase [Tepidisphaeraceae bacterium]|nr:UTP--glucose-1-phosphate uridylyltransferase [Tepidisphaeraceae bacterium]